MEKRLSYIVVGTFVIVLTISLLAFLFWLAKYGNKSIEHDYYNTYFKESVSGLNVESLVKLRGVEVGRVKKITINRDNSEEVEVLLEIIKDTPIKQDSYTVLDSQGITGLKYIELKGGQNISKLLETSKEKISTIPSKKSVMSSLFDSSESITNKVENILDKISFALNDKNLDNISKIIENFSQALNDKNIDNLNDIMSNLSTTTTYIDDEKEKLAKLLKKVHEFLDHTMKFESEIIPPLLKIGVASDKAGDAADKTGVFFTDMQKELDNGEFSIGTIIEENMQILNETAASIRDLSLELEGMVDSLKDSPSDILYKSNEKILGPGEKHE